MAPAKTREEGAQTAADEKDSHEDGVHPVCRLGQLPQSGTLVADLQTLRTNVGDDDGDDESCITVAPKPCREPSRDLQPTAYDRHPVNAHLRDNLPDATGGKGSSHATQSQHAHHIAARMEGGTSQMERHARPDAHHTGKTHGRTKRIKANTRIGHEDAAHRPHKLTV